MADTLANIEVPKSDWVDVYALSGIAVGTAMLMQNVGTVDIKYRTLATKPADDSAFNISGSSNQSVDRWVTINAGESGLWVKSSVNIGLINVQEV
ncbi:hypothetical protein N9980_00570 [bacterium]|nr:hypothetical protein [bacterium]